MFPGLLFPFPLAFPAQIAWADLTPGSVPTHPGGGTRSMTEDSWDWGGTLWITQLWIDSCSQGDVVYLKAVSWEEPAALPSLIFSLSGWHKSHHYWCSFYLVDLEKIKTFVLSPSVYIVKSCRVWNFSLMRQMAPCVLPFVYYILTPGSFICIYGEMLFFSVSVLNPDPFLKISIYPLRNMTGEVFP